MDFGFFRLEQSGSHKGNGNCLFRCFVSSVHPYGRERLAGLYSSVEEAVEAMMDPFNPLFLEDLEEHDFAWGEEDVW